MWTDRWCNEHDLQTHMMDDVDYTQSKMQKCHPIIDTYYASLKEILKQEKHHYFILQLIIQHVY